MAVTIALSLELHRASGRLYPDEAVAEHHSVHTVVDM
jgi:hypothetical protein